MLSHVVECCQILSNYFWPSLNVIEYFCRMLWNFVKLFLNFVECCWVPVLACCSLNVVEYFYWKILLNRSNVAEFCGMLLNFVELFPNFVERCRILSCRMLSNFVEWFRISSTAYVRGGGFLRYGLVGEGGCQIQIQMTEITVRCWQNGLFNAIFPYKIK